MPTNAELAKKIEALRDTLKKKLADWKKVISEGNEEQLPEFATDFKDVKTVISIMNKTFEDRKWRREGMQVENVKMRKPNDELAEANKSLKSQVQQLHQHSGLNESETRGVSNSAKEDLLSFGYRKRTGWNPHYQGPHQA